MNGVILKMVLFGCFSKVLCSLNVLASDLYFPIQRWPVVNYASNEIQAKVKDITDVNLSLEATILCQWIEKSTCSKLTIETLEKDVKYVQSQQKGNQNDDNDVLLIANYYQISYLSLVFTVDFEHIFVCWFDEN